MFLDFPEIVIIFGVALVVLGPKKLPGTAAQIGRWVGRARAMARQFREQLEQEVQSVESALDTSTPPREPTIRGPATPQPGTHPTPPPDASSASPPASSAPHPAAPDLSPDSAPTLESPQGSFPFTEPNSAPFEPSVGSGAAAREDFAAGLAATCTSGYPENDSAPTESAASEAHVPQQATPQARKPDTTAPRAEEQAHAATEAGRPSR